MAVQAEPTELPYIPVIIIGAGFSGIAMGAQLKRKLGIDDYVIYERDPEVGGTWYANTYPGCGVDVPSIFYSLSFAPNPDFTKLFPSQPEILSYIKSTADTFDVTPHIQLNTNWDGAAWDDVRKIWRVRLSSPESGERWVRECKVLISAVGGLVNPNPCEIPGKDTFKGRIVHTARWEKDVAVDDKDVIVIGNGCSGSQVVPAIAPQVKSLTQFIRSPQFYFPRRNPNVHPYLKWAFRYVPFVLLFFRWTLFNILEYGFTQFYTNKKGDRMRAKNKKISDDYVEKVAPKEYWDLLKPQYNVGCKRRVYDPGYLKALKKDNVHLTDDPIERIVEDGVVTKSGKHWPGDLIILATGFQLNSFWVDITGINDTTLQSHWSAFGGPEAYKSVAISAFPNYFTIFGPNSAVGHTSVLFSIENSINLVLKVVEPVLKGRKGSVAVKLEEEKTYSARQQEALAQRVWAGCRSYYKSDTGWNFTLYPFSMYRLWWQTAFPSMDAWSYGKLKND